MTEPDTDLLPYTRTQLSNAISALIDEKPHTLHEEDGTRIVWVESMLGQLEEAVTASQNTMHRGAARSKPPLWVDAVDLLHEINRTTRSWWPQPTLNTVGSLREIDAATWRPQDVPDLNEWTAQIRRWCTAIETLLSEERTMTVTGACPQCDTKTVHRWIDGERVRKPALQITTKGCVCLNCREVWPPERFALLAAALECKPIEGVLAPEAN